MLFKEIEYKIHSTIRDRHSLWLTWISQQAQQTLGIWAQQWGSPRVRLRSINCGFEKGEMSITQKQGVITCIPKEGKENFLKNWRPITLLNIAYKIASSCIAQRWKSVLPKLIHEDQKGFLKGGLLEKILHFFIQVSIMYVAFSSWLILRRLLTVWRGHLSKSRWLNSTLVAALYDGYKLFNVTLSLVCQLIDNILNGSMSKENWLVHFTRHLSIHSHYIYIYI